MQTRVVVVTLECIKDDENYDLYQLMSAREKIENLIRRIFYVCNELTQKEPHAKWMLVWPEYGIANNNKTCLTADEKSIFKKRLQDITRDYPQLAIIAGTVPTERIYAGVRTRAKTAKIKRKLSEIEVAYDAQAWVSRSEVMLAEEEMYREHRQQLRIMDRVSETCVVRNTAYVFVGGQCAARHDKIAPYMEWKRSLVSNGLFQIGKGRNANSLMTINYQDGVSIPICVEICRENFFGVARREWMDSGKERPVIHFVLSDTIDVANSKVIGQYLVHSDTRFMNELVQRRDSDVNVVQYSVNLLNSGAELSELCAPVDRRVTVFLP